MINWKVRFKNPPFIVSVLGSVFLPILAYMGINIEDLTSWSILWDVIVKAISNPFIVGTMVWGTYNAVIDFTTKGLKDSEQAKTYTEPK